MEIYKNRLTIVHLQSLRLSCGFDLLDSRLLHTAMKNTLISVSAEQDGEICGAARVVGDGAFVFFICDVMVDPRFRGAGLGSKLIKSALGFVGERLPQGAMAPVTLIASHGLEDFYVRLGFFTLSGAAGGGAMQAFVWGGKPGVI